MKTKVINQDGKKYFEKRVARFYEDDDCVQEFTLTTKKEMLDIYREYRENAKDEWSAEAVADDSFQIGRIVKGWAELKDTHERDITLGEMKEAGFILYYNPNEFMAWIGNEDLLERLAGDFSIKKELVEL